MKRSSKLEDSGYHMIFMKHTGQSLVYWRVMTMVLECTASLSSASSVPLVPITAVSDLILDPV